MSERESIDLVASEGEARDLYYLISRAASSESAVDREAALNLDALADQLLRAGSRRTGRRADRRRVGPRGEDRGRGRVRISLTDEQLVQLERSGSVVLGFTTITETTGPIATSDTVGSLEKAPAVTSSTGLAAKAARAARRLGVEAHAVGRLDDPWPVPQPRPRFRRKLPRARRLRAGLRRRHRASAPTRGDPDDPSGEPDPDDSAALHAEIQRIEAEIARLEAEYEQHRREAHGEGEASA
jgi:hypothetical protein